VTLSVLFRVPPSVIETWPERDVEELRVYFTMYGLPDPNLLTAEVLAMLVNVNRAKGKAASAFDFLPRAYRPVEEQTPAQIMDRLRLAIPET